MATTEDVYVRLKLDSKEFNTSIDKSNKKVSDFDGTVKETDKSMAGMAGTFTALGVGATALGTIIVANAVKMGELVQNTERYARSTGLATKEILAINLAMKELGIESEDTNEGLKTFAENIGDAILNSTGPAYEALNSLGISLESLQDLDTEQQFLLFAEALTKVERASERTFLAIQAGGEDFDRLNKAFSLGDGELRKLINTQKEYTDSLDIDKLSEMAEKTNELKVAWDKLNISLAQNTVPTLLKATNQINEWGEGFSHLLDLYAEWEAKGFKGSLFESLDGELTVGSSNADVLSDRLDAMKEISRQEEAFKMQLKEEQNLLLAKNKSEQLTIKQLEEQANIVRGMAEQADRDKATTLEGLKQREEVLKVEAELSEESSSFDVGFSEVSGVLERGTQAEASVSNQQENTVQINILREQQEQTKLLKKMNTNRGQIKVNQL